MFRTTDRNRRLLRLAEQAVFAVMLLFALHRFVPVRAPYAVYLFCGLAQWFYFYEAILSILAIPAQAMGLFDHGGYDPFWYPVAQALSALPTLLLWTGIAVIAALIYGLPVQLWQLLYLLPCAVYNTAAQGMFAAALLPLFRGGAQEGVAITMTYFFWTSPIAWPAGDALAGLPLLFFYLNPMHYLCETLRGALGAGAFPQVPEALLFAASAGVVGAAGYICMRRAWRGAMASWE